jgi:hypothetical protein
LGPPLTKIAAARRQLATAIRLQFDGGDLVSVFSLAANAWEVIDTLCVRAGVDSLSVQTREHLPPGKDLKSHYVNSPYRNFFKHADRDPEAVIEDLSESTVDSIVFLAVEDYIRLLKRSPIEFQVFQLWYLGLYRNKIATARLEEILESVESEFPGLTDLPRAEQIALGRKVLVEALKDKVLVEDASTEPAL